MKHPDFTAERVAQLPVDDAYPAEWLKEARLGILTAQAQGRKTATVYCNGPWRCVKAFEADLTKRGFGTHVVQGTQREPAAIVKIKWGQK